jgi:hypothetical protein
MSWAQRLKRVFAIQIRKCGGEVKIIACIEDELVIGKILTHLGLCRYDRNQERRGVTSQ